MRLAGSSPLTRGTRRDPTHKRLSVRFIPAYAGNSSIQRKKRVRCCGSSPLTRGTPRDIKIITALGEVHPRLRGELADLLRLVGWSVRFIPAYAGNSGVERPINTDIAVHPRLRGEL